ncbi:MAG: TraR/DksA family transcriptional regulator [Oligoflexia bacterium]|nr:TraR/DksA family transcriptional regulator [Oligoflexia bacterium]
MNAETIFKFKKLFEMQRRELFAKGLGGQDFHLPKDETIDDADMSSTELEAGMKMRLRSREALFLRKIDEALQRISDGTFGDCGSCGEEIDLRRLEARPTASLCVHCKEDQERQELAHIDGHKHKSLGRKLRLIESAS